MSTRNKISVVIISPSGRYTAAWPGLFWRSIPVEEITPAWSEGYRKLSSRWPLPREGESREDWAARFVAVHKWITQLTFEETVLPERADANDPRLRERPLPGTYQLVEGTVAPLAEHLELRHGTSGMPWEHRTPTARIAPQGEFQFTIEFLLEANTPENITLIEHTKRSAQFYLCDKCENDPWAYAQYHCNTFGNFYAAVQWAYFKEREQLTQAPTVSPPILLRSDGGNTEDASAGLED